MPLLIPDYLMLVDRSIEGRYHPKEHSLRGGLITITTSPYQHRHDAIVLIRSAGKKTTQPPWRWPRTIKDPILIPGNSACYAFQWAMLNGAGEIAMIGHDCNQNVLNEQGEKTHFYGINPVTGPKRAAGDITGVQVQFWQEALEKCRRCINLSPYATSPFQEKCHWPKESWDEYCAR